MLVSPGNWQTMLRVGPIILAQSLPGVVERVVLSTEELVGANPPVQPRSLKGVEDLFLESL